MAEPPDVAADDARILELKDQVTALNQEFDLATIFHAVWQPASADAALHGRMSHSYSGHAFLVIRTALRREMLLALARIWDSNRKSARLTKVASLLQEDGLVAALARKRAAKAIFADVVGAMQADLEGRAREVLALINKYLAGGTHVQALQDLLRLRHEQLAHRQLSPSTLAVGKDFEAGIESFYADTSTLMALLMGLANATACDPAETAEVYGDYAGKFWAGVQGDPSKFRQA